MAGSEGKDSATLAVGHIEGERLVVDLVREVRPPFNAETAVMQFAAVLKAYGIRKVVVTPMQKGGPRRASRDISSSTARTEFRTSPTYTCTASRCSPRTGSRW
jgi:hypothetical protein